MSNSIIKPKYDDGVCEDCWESYFPSCREKSTESRPSCRDKSTEYRQDEITCTTCDNVLEGNGLCYDCEIEPYECKAANCCTFTEEYLREHHEGLCQRHYREKYDLK